jgi:hypothetical protein
VGWRSLPLRIGLASGSANETSRLVIFSTARRWRIWRATIAARSATSSIRWAAASFVCAPRPRAAAQMFGDAARLAHRALDEPAGFAGQPQRRRFALPGARGQRAVQPP